MNKKNLSERDICSKFIGPAVKRAGWDGMMQIREGARLKCKPSPEFREARLGPISRPPSRTDRPRSSSGSDTVLPGFTMNQPVQPNYKIVEPLLRRPGGVPIDLHGGFLVTQPEVRQGGVI